MFDQKDTGYSRLDPEAASVLEESEAGREARLPTRLPSHVGHGAILWSSLAINGLVLFYLLSSWFGPGACISNEGRSRFAGLTYDLEMKFEYRSEYWQDNQTESDALWQDIDIDPVVIALSQEEVAHWRLPPSIPFPWDQSRSIYYLQSYHLIHCLKTIRRAYLDMELDIPGPALVKGHHVHHCLDMLRQYVICNADDTPMPGRYSDSAIGDGQTLQCRNMDRLASWAREGSRHACYRVVDQFAPVAHTLEKFQYCAPDSPYYDVMTRYFEENGHKPMFLEEHPSEAG